MLMGEKSAPVELEADEPGDLEMVAGDVLAAIKKGDAKALADALRAANTICYSEEE